MSWQTGCSFGWFSASLGGGAGAITGSGTPPKMPKFTGATTIGDSQMSDDGTTVFIGTAATSATAKFEVSSTTQGILLPRMTQTQRDNILTPADTLMIFNTNLRKFQWYSTADGAWITIESSAIGGETWAQTLANGNTSGGTNAVMTAGDIITTSSGSMQINLRLSTDDELFIGTDPVGFTGTALYSIESGTFEGYWLGYDNQYITNQPNNATVAKVVADAPIQIFGTGANIMLPSSTTTSNVSIAADGGQFNANVNNSTILAGDSIEANLDYTAFANQIALQSSANAFNGVLVPTTLTASRTYTFQNASGTVAFLTDVSGHTWAAALTAGNSTSAANNAVWSKLGTATSTATQQGSTKARFEMSLWDGAAEDIQYWDIEAIASTSLNQTSRLAFTVDGTEKGAFYSTSFGIGTGATLPNATVVFREADTSSTTQVFRVDVDATDNHFNIRGNGRIAIGGTGALNNSATIDMQTVSGTNDGFAIYGNRVGGANIGDLNTISWAFNNLSGTRVNASSIISRVEARDASIVRAALTINGFAKVRQDGGGQLLLRTGALTQPALAMLDVVATGNTNTTMQRVIANTDLFGTVVYGARSAGGTNLFNIRANGYIGVGLNPNSFLHLRGGTTTAPQLKFANSTLTSTPQNGAMEYSSDFYYLSTGNIRTAISTFGRTVVNAANYLVLITDRILGVTRTATGTAILTLPTAATFPSGYAITIKDEGNNATTNSITINAAVGETIDTLASQIINTDLDSMTIYSNGSNGWFIK